MESYADTSSKSSIWVVQSIILYSCSPELGS